jgi:hypothetical protein
MMMMITMMTDDDDYDTDVDDGSFIHASIYLIYLLPTHLLIYLI